MVVIGGGEGWGSKHCQNLGAEETAVRHTAKPSGRNPVPPHPTTLSVCTVCNREGSVSSGGQCWHPGICHNH